MITYNLHVQGHRGARGRKPENTLPSFEFALDVGVDSIETDVHLTLDRVAVLHHDALLHNAPGMLLSRLSLEELRRYRVDGNPDPVRFPEQDAIVTPLADLFARQNGIDPYAIPTLEELFRFVSAYAGPLGAQAGKSEQQRQKARDLWFDLELKRVPFHPEVINDGFDGVAPALLEEQIVRAVRQADVTARTMVRSFDHRCVRAIRRMEPMLTGGVLIAETAPVDPAELLERADAQVYCPDYRFLDAQLVKQVHAAGAKVLPWTVNQPSHWQRLLDWGVDGITTDVPDRLAMYLRERR